MVVEFKQATNEKEFGELEDGAVFGFIGSFYIKMYCDLKTEVGIYNAVNLEDGEPTFFADDDEVIEYPKAKTVIE